MSERIQLELNKKKISWLREIECINKFVCVEEEEERNDCPGVQISTFNNKYPYFSP